MKVFSAVNGTPIWQYTDPRANKLLGRQLKVTIAKMMKAASPFSIRLMVGQEPLTMMPNFKNILKHRT